jgi:hypothetical protein
MKHAIHLTDPLEKIIEKSAKVKEDDTTTPTAFDAWLHPQIFQLGTPGGPAGFNAV